MATTITLPNGVRIDTTDEASSLVALLGTAPTVPTTQPEAPTVPTQPKKAKPSQPSKKATQPKPKASQARTQRPKVDGKQLWADITSAISDGRYEDARNLASEKPDTFGVQAEAAIQRHQARSSKAGQRTVAKSAKPKQPKADAAKAATAEPKARQAPAMEVLDNAAEQREAARILDKALAQAESLAAAMDTDGLREATKTYVLLANRNERLGRSSLYEAYKDAADLCQDALAEAKSSLAVIG